MASKVVVFLNIFYGNKNKDTESGIYVLAFSHREYFIKSKVNDHYHVEKLGTLCRVKLVHDVAKPYGFIHFIWYYVQK